MWILTNKYLGKFSTCVRMLNKHYYFYTNEKLKILKDIEGNEWFYTGYIVLRNNQEKLSNENEDNLIVNLYRKFGYEFINKIKGNFTVVQFLKNSFRIFSDHLAINKYFYFTDGSQFGISNDIQIITRNFVTQPVPEHIAIYALTYHFFGGITIFKNVRYNLPGEILDFKLNRISINRHWHPYEITQNKSKRRNNLKQISKVLEGIIHQYLFQNHHKQISLSLTAGMDCRLLLSAILIQNINEIHCYTYGNIDSVDCKIAARIAKKFNLAHSIYDVQFDYELFREFAEKSVKIGQSLCSLHRAHRVAAIEKESEYADTMILGTMGGEFIKGVNRDDFNNNIISNFVFEYSQQPSRNLLLRFLDEKCINYEEMDLDYIENFFSSQSWISNESNANFLRLIELAASIHHTQNNIQYSRFFKHVFTPFCDVDYLEAMARSKYMFLNRKGFNIKFYRKLTNPRYASKMQLLLLKSLSNIPYDSGFTPKEYCLNPLFAGITSYIRKSNWEMIPNFPLTNWMYEFVIEKYKEMEQSKSIAHDIFNFKKLNCQLAANSHESHESYWLKFTTPIQMQMILSFFY